MVGSGIYADDWDFHKFPVHIYMGIVWQSDGAGVYIEQNPQDYQLYNGRYAVVDDTDFGIVIAWG